MVLNLSCRHRLRARLPRLLLLVLNRDRHLSRYPTPNAHASLLWIRPTRSSLHLAWRAWVLRGVRARDMRRLSTWATCPSSSARSRTELSGRHALLRRPNDVDALPHHPSGHTHRDGVDVHPHVVHVQSAHVLTRPTAPNAAHPWLLRSLLLLLLRNTWLTRLIRCCASSQSHRLHLRLIKPLESIRPTHAHPAHIPHARQSLHPIAKPSSPSRYRPRLLRLSLRAHLRLILRVM